MLVTRGTPMDSPRSRPASNRGLVALLLALSALVGGGLAGASAGESGDFDPDGWLHGAAGLFEALRQVKTSSKPLVVYFYADWCGYCRQFERELLGTPEVRRYLEDVHAVMINPEKGARERELAAYYRVQGYPALFVRGRSSGSLARVERYRMVGGRPEMLSPGELVDAIEQASRR